MRCIMAFSLLKLMDRKLFLLRELLKSMIAYKATELMPVIAVLAQSTEGQGQHRPPPAVP